jgi:hypothetical protein
MKLVSCAYDKSHKTKYDKGRKGAFNKNDKYSEGKSFQSSRVKKTSKM